MFRPGFLIGLLFLFTNTLNGLANESGDEYINSSVLSEGLWFKMAVTEDGIYRIDFSELRDLGLVNPGNPRIFGNNNGQLSYYNNGSVSDDLTEIPLIFRYSGDSIFSEGDYILFYAEGTGRWSFNYNTKDYRFIRHNYSDTAYYFLTSGTSMPKEVKVTNNQNLSATTVSESYDALYIHEKENENILRSGREWYEPLSQSAGININPGFRNIITGEPVKYTLRVLARSSAPVSFRLYEAQNILTSRLVSEVNLTTTTGTYARTDSVSGAHIPSSQTPSYELKYYNNGAAGSKAWLDYITIQGRALTEFTGKTLQFSDSRSVIPGSVTEFRIKSTQTDILILDVTDHLKPEVLQYNVLPDNVSFKAKSDYLNRFIICNPEKALHPLIRSTPVEHQNLHSSSPADMIIVCHPLFLKQAEKLADIHLRNSGLISLIVTPEQIYNEFSGGIPDIVAIRNFNRMMYKKFSGSSHSLKYLLLFGDGSVENKTPPPYNPNYIPTYQTRNSNVIVSSFTSDDFYCLLDDNEGEFTGTEDLGVGRLPVSDTLQAAIIVNKIEQYISGSSDGKWENLICIAADDEDGNTHIADAEELSEQISVGNPEFTIDKIYFDAYIQETTATGQSYPEANRAVNDRINSGCLIFNYIGHGNELGLAHERVVKMEDINGWRNSSALPLFITATCEFGRFDNIEYNIVTREITGINSAGEMVLFNPSGGGIALMTTTRVVYSSPNYILNKSIYKYAFDIDSDGNPLRLGDIFRLAKLNTGTGINKRNFSLLGDPAVRLSFPSDGKVMTDSINGIPVSREIDSLKALSLITVSGHINDNNGNMIENFNGLVFPTVYDKKSVSRTRANDGGNTIAFETQNNILFSGRANVKNGRFSYTFIVPRDIDYSFGNGRISYYSTNNDLKVNGVFNDLKVGGFSNTIIADTTGPLIRLFLNDTLFRSGGITDRYPVLLARIEDESGINTTGSGIGHDITAILNGFTDDRIVLNNFFETDADNYRHGKIEYKLGDTETGRNLLTLKVWDNFNNSSSETLVFIVRTDNGFILKNLINYPNPFENGTWITAEHNRPEKEMDIEIQIYSMSGKLIKVINNTITTSGYKIPPLFWDGNTDGGYKAGGGIYPYKIIIKTEDKEIVTGSGRLIIL